MNSLASWWPQESFTGLPVSPAGPASRQAEAGGLSPGTSGLLDESSAFLVLTSELLGDCQTCHENCPHVCRPFGSRETILC